MDYDINVLICCGVTKVKNRATKDVFNSVAEIAEDVIHKRVKLAEPCRVVTLLQQPRTCCQEEATYCYRL